MDLNYTNTAVNHSNEIRSVFICPEKPYFVWDLTNNVVPWILFTVASIASPAIILLNGLIIVAIRQRKELRKLSNILLSSLAVADLLVGGISLPLSATVDFVIARQVLLENVCLLDSVNVLLMFAFSTSSLYHLTFIAWERYVAIQKWMAYRTIVTKRRLTKLAIVAWFGGLMTLLGIPLKTIIADPKFELIWVNIMIVLPAISLFLTMYFYIMVCFGVRKRKLSEINQVSALVAAKLQNKAAKTTGLITAALVVSFVPAVVVGIFGNFLPAFRTNSAFRPTEILVQLSSVANPIVYCYRDRCFRNAVLELLRLRKPLRTKPENCPGRFVRRRNAIDSLRGIREQQNTETCTTRLARSMSYDQVLVSGYAAPRKSLGATQKRSMSVPSLAKPNSSCSDLQEPKQTRSIVITAQCHALP